MLATAIEKVVRFSAETKRLREYMLVKHIRGKTYRGDGQEEEEKNPLGLQCLLLDILSFE